MSCFSCTAPQVSKEDEIAERLALSEQEKYELNSDIFGNRDSDNEEEIKDSLPIISISQDPEQIISLIQTVKETIFNLPNKEIKEYLDALEKAPDLVHMESNIILFLEYDDYDTLAASKRLALYWKARKEIFGEDLAYLPMKLNGAMKENRDDIEKGILQILPNDENGRTVLFWDRIRAVKGTLCRQSHFRIIFYMLHIISNKGTKKERSVVTIVNLKCYDVYRHFDRQLIKKKKQLMQLIPVYVKAIHAFYGSGGSVLDFVFPVVKQIMGRNNRLRFLIHIGSDREIVEKLATYGITCPYLKECVNGSYKRSIYFRNWLLEQEKHENKCNFNSI